MTGISIVRARNIVRFFRRLYKLPASRKNEKFSWIQRFALDFFRETCYTNGMNNDWCSIVRTRNIVRFFRHLYRLPASRKNEKFSWIQRFALDFFRETCYTNGMNNDWCSIVRTRNIVRFFRRLYRLPASRKNENFSWIQRFALDFFRETCYTNSINNDWRKQSWL